MTYFDGNDIDNIVRHFTLTQIEDELQRTKFLLKASSKAMIPFWKDRVSAYELALDVAISICEDTQPIYIRHWLNSFDHIYRHTIRQIEGKANYAIRKLEELTKRKKDTTYIYNSINREDDAQA